METFKHENRVFTVVSKTLIESLPNLQKAFPDVDYYFVAKGKRNALISGCHFKNGTFNVFPK